MAGRLDIQSKSLTLFMPAPVLMHRCRNRGDDAFIDAAGYAGDSNRGGGRRVGKKTPDQKRHHIDRNHQHGQKQEYYSHSGKHQFDSATHHFCHIVKPCVETLESIEILKPRLHYP